MGHKTITCFLDSKVFNFIDSNKNRNKWGLPILPIYVGIFACFDDIAFNFSLHAGSLWPLVDWGQSVRHPLWYWGSCLEPGPLEGGSVGHMQHRAALSRQGGQRLSHLWFSCGLVLQGGKLYTKSHLSVHSRSLPVCPSWSMNWFSVLTCRLWD